jgi:signal transduction histidine kinase
LLPSFWGVTFPVRLDRIFDKFYRVPQKDPWKYSGTGLGLALIKKLVDALAGQIRVESADHQVTFTLTLPQQWESRNEPEKTSISP